LLVNYLSPLALSLGGAISDAITWREGHFRFRWGWLCEEAKAGFQASAQSPVSFSGGVHTRKTR
jgi:hypothetical protein